MRGSCSAALALAIASLSVTLAASGCASDDEPAWCAPSTSQPLEVRCPATHCVAAAVIDYKRLEPRGYRIFALEGSPIDDEEAKKRARDFVRDKRKANPMPDLANVDRSGDFIVVFLAYSAETIDDEWLVVIHQPSGQVLFAEPQLWANKDLRGYDFPLPDGFSGPEALGCVDKPRFPVQRPWSLTTGQPFTGALSSAEDAYNVARRLNLTAKLGEGAGFRVFIVSYAPAIGEFDAESADWYAWLHRAD